MSALDNNAAELAIGRRPRRFICGLAHHSSAGILLCAFVALVLASQEIYCASPADKASGPTPELVLRAGAGLIPVFGAVVFSPDGTLVAIETSEHLIVFDLTWNTELRRFPLKSTVLSRRMVFPHRGQKLFIEDGKTILECELDSNEQCKTLANDAFEGGAFAVSEEDRWLAYLDQNKIPEAIDLRNGGPKIRFSGLVSASDDLASFWSLATFSSDSKLLAVARGGRDALLFRMEPKPHFDSSRPISGGSYDMSFDRENRLFVCIMVQNGDNLAWIPLRCWTLPTASSSAG